MRGNFDQMLPMGCIRVFIIERFGAAFSFLQRKQLVIETVKPLITFDQQVLDEVVVGGLPSLRQ